MRKPRRRAPRIPPRPKKMPPELPGFVTVTRKRFLEVIAAHDARPYSVVFDMLADGRVDYRRADGLTVAATVGGSILFKLRLMVAVGMGEQQAKGGEQK